MKIQKPVLYTAIAILIASGVFFITSYNNTERTRETFAQVTESHARLNLLNSLQPAVDHLQILTYRRSTPEHKKALAGQIAVVKNKQSKLSAYLGSDPDKSNLIQDFLASRIRFAEKVRTETVSGERINTEYQDKDQYNAFVSALAYLKNIEEQNLTSATAKNKKVIDSRFFYSFLIGFVSLIAMLMGLLKINKVNLKRKEAERKATANEAKYKGLIENAAVVMYTTDTKGRFNYASSKCLELTGYTEDELLGKSFDYLIPLEKREEVANFYLKQLMQMQRETNYRFPIVTKYGENKWVEQSVVLQIENGEFKGFQSIVRDITETKLGEDLLEKAEEMLRVQREENQFRLQSILDNIPMIVYIKDLDGRFVMINERFRKEFGLTDEKVIGKYSHDVNKISGAMGTYAITDESIKETRQPIEVEDIVMTVHGQRHMLVTKFPLFDKNNELFAISGVDKDITDMVKNRQALIDARQRAEQAEKLQEEFLANMSHEIRTPMNGIMGMTSLLSETSLNSEQEEYVALIRQSSETLLSLINDILDISKIKAGRMTVEEVDFNIHAVVDGVIGMMKLRTREKGIALRKNVSPVLHGDVRGDQHKLMQVLNNLLSNAVKFTSEGEVTVTVSQLDETESTVKLEFIVADTGIGISKEYIDRIFESFVQGGDDMVRCFGGTGLGLTITRRLIEMQGGTISVESEAGKGSNFRFSLEFLKSATKESLSPQHIVHADLSMLKGRNILLVEDNPVNQKVANGMLQKAGLVVQIAGNGAEAVRLLEQDHKYDLIIMDLQMPEMDGFQATKYIREKLRLDTPIIAMTASALRNEKDKCLSVGMNAYLTKPFLPSELFRNMQQLLLPEVHETYVPKNEWKSDRLYSMQYLLEMDDEDYIREVLGIFIDTTPQILGELQKGLLAGDFKVVASYAHKLISSLGILQVTRMLHNIKQIEQIALTSPDIGKISELLQAVKEEYSVLEPALIEELKIYSNPLKLK